MSLSNPDAAELARRLSRASRAGSDPESVADLMQQVNRLFADHQDRVYAYCLRFLRKPERALELSQDTLLLAYQKLPGFRGEARFDTWLYKIARFLCLNSVRKRGDLLAEDGIIEVTDPSRSALSGLRRAEREALIRDCAAAALDATEQEVVYLRYVEQLPLAVIDEMVQIEGASGARGVLQRCKRKLRAEVLRRLDELSLGSSFLRDSTE